MPYQHHSHEPPPLLHTAAVHDIHIVERLNEGGVLELLEGLLHTDRDTLVPGVFTVHGDVTFNSQLNVHTVNGRPWTSYLSSVGGRGADTLRLLGDCGE